MATGLTSVASPLVSCLHLCDGIWSQLSTAKHNEKECVSLKALTVSIRSFLKPLEFEQLSEAGQHAIGKHFLLAHVKASCNSIERYTAELILHKW